MTSATEDVGFDLEVTKLEKQETGDGTWVRGRLSGHKFNALVYGSHAENEEYELGQSRLSKLWVQRLADNVTVFNWDRGMDVEAKDEVAQAIVDFLAGGLADYVDAHNLR